MRYMPGELVTVREGGGGGDIPLFVHPTDHPDPILVHEPLGRMHPGELALVLKSHFDGGAQWWCVQILKDGMLGWVISPHIVRAER